jgi:hypothetical protein
MASGARKKTAKKSAKKAAPSAAKRKAAFRKSISEVKKAQRNLDLKVKKHHEVVSAMFFFG